MFYKIRILSLLCFSLVLFSCATLSKQECLKGNWKQIGLKDGSNGYPEDRWNNHVKACTPHGVTFDQNLYLQGRTQGLVRYCTPEKGLEEGREGRTYHDVCPADLEKPFLKNYKIGKEIHRLNQEITKLESEIDQLETQLDDKNLKPEDRRLIRRRIRDKDEQVRVLKKEVRSWEETGNL